MASVYMSVYAGASEVRAKMGVDGPRPYAALEIGDATIVVTSEEEAAAMIAGLTEIAAHFRAKREEQPETVAH